MGVIYYALYAVACGILLIYAVSGFAFLIALFGGGKRKKDSPGVTGKIYRVFQRLPSWLQTTLQFAWGIGSIVLVLWIYEMLD